ncbi:MAG: hypothetical protein A3F70_18405 [Acidobacteria bacterium RIFCSPLOWO2_12_FULL_67_14]|nr:MAG: hypothetical protein A3H29_19835 [Acidobacteria bacterium RIFCSPLOWO2_02_FULL_67_21]OFW36014.1 MAG: hypothetical protein A3F70_18405 [Acidobacteria bacterium RIFCSPLOWO2_12_FULL_67_14]
MQQLADELRAQVDVALAALRAFDDVSADISRGPGKWTRKEILGHLIDSAANNHQRFMRAQLAGSYAGPGYEQEAWVRVQQYGARSWRELVDLWAALNRHLAYAMESVPASKLSTSCIVGDDEAVTLEWMMRDYLRHLQHHLDQLLA